MKDIGEPCEGELHARFDEGAMKKYLGVRKARVCKLPSEADRAELLRSACKATRHRPTLP